jgi:transposase
MVHVHGVQAQRLAAVTDGADPHELIAVAIDVGKHSAMALVCDFAGELLARPFEFAMSRPGIELLVARVTAATSARSVRLVRVGIEAAGHYHRPVVSAGVLPVAWQVVQCNPAHVAAQRHVAGRRGVKTDHTDLVAISDLVRAGHGGDQPPVRPVLLELRAWVAHRDRRVAVRSATKNQLLGQVDRVFPGLAGCLADVLGTKIGRLLVSEGCDPAHLVGLGPDGLRALAADRGVLLQATLARRLVRAAQDALVTDHAAAARAVLATDVDLLTVLDAHVQAAEQHLARLLPQTAFQVLTTTPGWGVVRVTRYAAAVGDLARWPSPRQLYRASGLTPTVYASAGRRRDGAISREGSVLLRRALLDLGVGLWHCDPPARAYAAALRARGKPGGVIACALAHRANRIAYALVRDQLAYDPDRWPSQAPGTLTPDQPASCSLATTATPARLPGRKAGIDTVSVMADPTLPGTVVSRRG